jgi:hypothetical protein
MKTANMFKKDTFYIIRAEKAGVFIGKISFIEGETVGVNALRRLYRWSGALDVTMIATNGVTNASGCKFSVQLPDTDLSIINNVVEMHQVSEKALTSLNAVPVWKS